MSFPRYPAYKDSGVEWLGEVPEHWDVHRFKWQIERNDGGAWGDEPDGIDDMMVLRSTEQTIDGEWRLDDPAFRKLSHKERCSTLLKEGDLVVTKSSGSAAHIGKTTIVHAQLASMGCCYSNFMQRIRLQPSLHPRLAWYVMNNEVTRKQFDYLSNTTTGLANLNGTMISMAMVPMPTFGEQRLIVAFLDRETAKIDALIAEQQRLIELLQEKRQAVISQAVTKGLNPEAPMKDSGVEWLGEVPEHWEVLELKHLKKEGSSITYGIVQAGPHIDEGIPYIRTSDMAGDRLRPETCLRTSSEIDQAYARSKVEAGDLVIAIRASVGKVLEVPIELHGANLTQGTAKFSPGGKANVLFVRSSFEADYCQAQIMSCAKGATFLEITLDALRRLKLAIPPLEEQGEIVQYLANVKSGNEELLRAAEQTIALLQERRSALISAAVTGQINVRGLVPEASAA
jgi:type I restriction enzyme S subunit